MITPTTIHAGATPLASTLTVEQTGPMQITVRAGQFTTTGDARAQVVSTTYVLAADVVFLLTSDPSAAKLYLWEFGLLSGTPDVLCRSQIDGEAAPAAPADWQTVQWLADGVVPAGATSLDAVDLRAFTVLPGFPLGTSAAEWREQRVRVVRV